MKNLFIFLGVVFFITGISSGCSDNIKQANVELKAENVGLKNEVQLLQSQIADLNKTIQVLENKQQDLEISQQDLETSHQKTIALLEDKQHQAEISYKEDLEKLQAELAQVENEAQTLKTNSEVKVEQMGRLRVNVTYKYNEFIGNRADVDSTVWLQAINSKTNYYLGKAYISGNHYSGKVGGDGYAVINQIIPGKYLCVINSQNTRSGGSVSQEDADLIHKYFDEIVAESELTSAAISKIKTMIIDVPAGDETQISYDFGLSVF